MKQKLKKYDYVRLLDKYDDRCEIGEIKRFDRSRNVYEVWICGLNTDDTIAYAPDRLEYLPTKKLSKEDLKHILCLDDCGIDILKQIVPENNYEYVDKYKILLDDLICFLKNANTTALSEADILRIIDMLFYDYDDNGGYVYDYSLCDETSIFTQVPESDAQLSVMILSALEGLSCCGNKGYKEAINYSVILEDIDKYKRGLDVSPFKWTYTNMRELCSIVKAGTQQDEINKHKDDIKDIILRLADEGDIEGIAALGYSYYGGNELFECDWHKSRDCFLRLMDNSEADDLNKCQWANTLGYIYYYGRCNNGVPEYDKAFQYFSIGAAGGFYESLYKLSDMYLHGYYVAKNKRAAKTLVDFVYSENQDLILSGKYDCQFADAALRMGNLCRDGIMDSEEAYFYYTLADFAIRKRAIFNRYGDNNVFMGIQRELSRIREKEPLREYKPLKSELLPDIVYRLLNGYSCLFTLKQIKNGIKIKVKRMPSGGNEAVKKVFDCYPEYGYCHMISEMEFTAKGVTDLDISGKEVIVDDIEMVFFKDSYCYDFYHHGEKVASFYAEVYIYNPFVKAKRELAEYTFVSVEFNEGGNTYDYICDIDGVAVGDMVIVNASGEMRAVKVKRIFTAAIGDMPLDTERYKKILSK